jgi:GPH family glycoside/pentoside/hexuronide:cation symporter
LVNDLPLLELSGFEQTASSPDGLLTLALLYAALPILLKIWVAWKMWYFPFSGIDFHDYWEPQQ